MDAYTAAISALAHKSSHPTFFQKQAKTKIYNGPPTKPKLGYAKLFGHTDFVPVDKAILANCSAVSTWNLNYSYPIIMAAA